MPCSHIFKIASKVNTTVTAKSMISRLSISDLPARLLAKLLGMPGGSGPFTIMVIVFKKMTSSMLHSKITEKTAARQTLLNALSLSRARPAPMRPSCDKKLSRLTSDKLRLKKPFV